MDTKSISEALKYIINQYGIDVLNDGSRCNAILSDIVPTLTIERKMLAVAFNNNFVHILVTANSETEREKERAGILFKKKLIDQAFLNDNAASQITTIFLTALDWNIVPSPQDITIDPILCNQIENKEPLKCIVTNNENTSNTDGNKLSDEISNAILETEDSSKFFILILSGICILSIIISIIADIVLYKTISNSSKYSILFSIIFCIIYTICQYLPLLFSLVINLDADYYFISSNIPYHIKHSPLFKKEIKNRLKSKNIIRIIIHILVIIFTAVNVLITIFMPVMYYVNVLSLPLDIVKMIILPAIIEVVLPIVLIILLMREVI